MPFRVFDPVSGQSKLCATQVAMKVELKKVAAGLLQQISPAVVDVVVDVGGDEIWTPVAVKQLLTVDVV